MMGRRDWDKELREALRKRNLLMAYSPRFRGVLKGKKVETDRWGIAKIFVDCGHKVASNGKAYVIWD